MKPSTSLCYWVVSSVFVLVVFVFAESTTDRSRLQAAEQSANFVVILCDDLGYGDLGCYGHPTINTPHLDRLAAEGMKLTDCYAAAPVCSPARAGLITGRTPYRCGIYDWIPDGSPMHLGPGEITIATLLSKAGYATCHVGKWHLGGKFNQPAQPQPGDHGFDHWFSTQNNALPTHKHPHNFVRNGVEVGPTSEYSSTLIVDEALAWLERRDPEKPFCLFVWFHSPHEVVATPDEFTAMYPQAKNRKQAEYFGNVTHLDREVGRLLKTIDGLGLRDDSFVFFTSDNGPETLNRYGPRSSRSYGTPGPLRGMKLHMYEGGIRVPGIIRWPGHTQPGQVVHEPVSAVDLLPTLAEIAGTDVPRDRPLDGTSLLPLLGAQPLKRSVPLYWQYDRALSEPTIAIRHGDWKLLSDPELQTFELYNLKHDPAETANLAKTEPQRLHELTATLKTLHAAIEQEGRRSSDWPLPQKRRAR